MVNGIGMRAGRRAGEADASGCFLDGCLVAKQRVANIRVEMRSKTEHGMTGRCADGRAIHQGL